MKKNRWFYKIALIAFFTGLTNGLFGSGGGTVLVPCLVFLLGTEDHKAHATAIAVILPLSIVSSFIYFRYNVVDLPLTLKVVLGSMAGAFAGSMLLNRISVNILRKVFGAFMILAAIRMVF